MTLEHCDVCCTLTESHPFNSRCKQCGSRRSPPRPRDNQWTGVAAIEGDGRVLGFSGIKIT